MAANLLENDSSFVRMIILTDDRQKAPLTRVEAYEIEKYIFDQISTIDGKCPLFKGQYVFSDVDGAIIINTHVDSVNWLKEVIGSYKQKVLRITYIENSPQYIARVKADVTRLERKFVDNLFVLLQTHNIGLKTDHWRFVKTYQESVYCGAQRKNVTYAQILIDDPGLKMLQKNQYTLFLGFSTLKFQFIGTVKRNETTGKI